MPRSPERPASRGTAVRAAAPQRRALLSPQVRAFLARARRAHLATASAAAEPHVVPICFALLGADTIVFAIDDKPKTPGRTLKRLRNLAENARFALVVDRWSERWRQLAYVLVTGRGAPLGDTRRRAAAVRALRRRYPQYRAMQLDAARHAVIALTVERVHAWGRLAARATPRRSARSG